ncbi:HAD-IA family hydrolase (plasmid) [Agrobacterium leguminum]|uniref:HAD family hydrolase n=1 Tax=Agrobacterium leguminum TaxID=2792015 RepID=UPI00272A431C|nr:HAD-IA family hydrolase [Agrobacterium leguminum]WLE00722.1 HAD-IA family hydrolase [Agrobacterium leguminum]
MTGALILDFGGVVTRTLFETHAVTEKALGLAAGTLNWQGPFDTSTDPLWVSMQNRDITERDYWLTRAKEVGALVGEDWNDMQTFVRRARGADADLVLRPEARDAILKTKEAGLKLAILSNELDLFYGVEFRKRFPLIELFDVIVDATYTKILKPDPRSYGLVLAELDLPKEACVFVDDQKKNIEGADAVGLPNVHFDVTQPAAGYARALAMLGL